MYLHSRRINYYYCFIPFTVYDDLFSDLNACYVNFYSPWNRGHAGDYDLPELFNWMDSICKAK